MKNVKNLAIFVLMTIFTLGVFSCDDDDNEPLPGYKKVEADRFKANIESSKRNGTPQIIDYRSPEEYKAGHIEDAVNIYVTDKNAEKEIKAALTQFDQNRNIYVYGSEKTNNTLGFYLAGIVSGQGWGEGRTFDLLGGFESWEAAGYPIVTEGETQQ